MKSKFYGLFVDFVVGFVVFAAIVAVVLRPELVGEILEGLEDDRTRRI